METLLYFANRNNKLSHKSLPPFNQWPYWKTFFKIFFFINLMLSRHGEHRNENPFNYFYPQCPNTIKVQWQRESSTRKMITWGQHWFLFAYSPNVCLSENVNSLKHPVESSLKVSHVTGIVVLINSDNQTYFSVVATFLRLTLLSGCVFWITSNDVFASQGTQHNTLALQEIGGEGFINIYHYVS